MIPGACMRPGDLVAAGFLADVSSRGLALEVRILDCDAIGTTLQGAAPAPAAEALQQARREGHRRIWLGGISLGGLLALAQALDEPDSLDGLCLIAPYPGSRPTLAAIERAGGLAAWRPTPDQLDDTEFRVWNWLRRPPASLPVFVGWGDQDRFAQAIGQLAGCFPPGTAAWSTAGTSGRRGARSGSGFSTAATSPLRFAWVIRSPPGARRNMQTSWKPAPAIKWSAALHAAAAAGVVLAPGTWPWALGAVAADHLLLTAAGLWPRTTVLGPNLVRLPEAAAARREIALTIDDGPDPDVTPAVLDMLDAAGAKASFFCIGARAAPASRPVPRNRRARPSCGEPRRFPLEGFRSFRARAAACGHRRRPGRAARDHRPGSALLPPDRRLAQPLARPGTLGARPAAGGLDAPGFDTRDRRPDSASTSG